MLLEQAEKSDLEIKCISQDDDLQVPFYEMELITLIATRVDKHMANPEYPLCCGMLA